MQISRYSMKTKQDKMMWLVSGDTQSPIWCTTCQTLLHRCPVLKVQKFLDSICTITVFWDVTQHRLVMHWCFRNTYQSHLHHAPWIWDPYSPKTLVQNQPMLRNVPDDQVNRSESLRSRAASAEVCTTSHSIILFQMLFSMLWNKTWEKWKVK